MILSCYNYLLSYYKMSYELTIERLNELINVEVYNDIFQNKINNTSFSEEWFCNNIYYLINKWTNEIFIKHSSHILKYLNNNDLPSLSLIEEIKKKCSKFIDYDKEKFNYIEKDISLDTLIKKYICYYIYNKTIEDDVYNYNYTL